MNSEMALSVSIIVPVYNVEDFVEDCFQSIASQTYTGPMECLFIDDCGTDRSIEKLNNLIEEYDGPIEMRIFHHEMNRGLSAARNTGLLHSKGEYVFFLDSDDLLFPKTIDSLTRVAICKGYPDIILGSYKISIPDHPLNQYKYKELQRYVQPDIAKAFLKGTLFCMVPNKLIRKSFISDNDLNFKEGIIHEDNLWSFQSFHMANSVITIPDVTYYYFIRSGSIMTSSLCERRLESTRVIYDEVLNDINEGRYAPISEDSLNYVKDILNSRCLRVFEQFYSRDYNRKERISALKGIPQESKKIIKNYWFAPTIFLKTLKFLFKFGYYRLFDILMMFSLKKNVKQSLCHSSCL